MHRLAVAATWRETDEALGVRFAVPTALAGAYAFRAGQYLTLETDVGGERLRRSYSICAPEGGAVQIAIKRIDGGKFSEFAHAQLRAGSLVDVAEPQGAFTFEADET